MGPGNEAVIETSGDSAGNYLFLMEFFVYHIDSDRLNKLNGMICTPTSVYFAFPNIEQDDIEVVSVNENFTPLMKIKDDVEHINAGKSMLFAVSKENFSGPREFFIYLRVQKNNADNLNVDVASGALDFSDEFAHIHQKAMELSLSNSWSSGNVPDAQIFNGNVPLKYQSDFVGYVKVYLRLSVLGETVVTEFQDCKGNESKLLFNSDLIPKDHVYECTKIEQSQECENINNAEGPCDECCCEQQVAGDFDSNKQAGLIQTSRGTVQPCGKAVVLKVSGLLEGDGQCPKVQVASESEAISPEMAHQHDVFVLRIGKKGIVGPGEKSDLQLELKTPKGPENRPPIRYETRHVQTEEDSKGAKKGKGKGKGKGKPKKGKGKKK